MENSAYRELIALSREKEAQKKSVQYIAAHLSLFLKRNEKVLICFPEHEAGDLSDLMEQAVRSCGAVPVFWGPDRRWNGLLQLAFFSRASTIIGPPLVILGLTKLKKNTGIPLYIRHVVTAGYPCLDWMIEGIKKGLDCDTWGCFGISTSSVVAGFSCGKSLGVHLREEEFSMDIIDDQGNPLPEREMGEMVLFSKERPDLRYPCGEKCYIDRSPCPCGRTSPRLMGMFPGGDSNMDLAEFGQYLHSWTSVLDCRLKKGEFGLELEMIVFAGEKLPKLPSCAKQVIRPWDPKRDEPFFA